MSKINWAILGGGRMSKVFAETIFKDKNSNLVSIVYLITADLNSAPSS